MRKLLTLNLLSGTLAQFREVIPDAPDATALQARHMYEGYHLGRPLGGGEMDLAYWRGPNFDLDTSGTEAHQRQAQTFVSQFQAAVRRSFTSTNFVKQILVRELGSVTGRMNWTMMDSQRAEDAEPTPREREADQLLTSWWRRDRSEVERTIRRALLFARREGAGALRFRVSRTALQVVDGRARVATSNMEEIARSIVLEAIEQPEHLVTWQNPDDLTRHAIYSYKTALEEDAAEVSSVQPDGRTLLRVLKGNASSGVLLKLGGRLTLLRLQIEPLITPQVLQNQMAYNTASTMILRNTELAGFIERYGVNIEPPYTLEPDPDNPGQQRRAYLPVKTGAASLNLWRGATYDKTDADGTYQGEVPLGSPEYGRFEPVTPDSLTAAAEHSRLNIYGEVAQDYVLMSGDSTATGRSREVAISDFEIVRAPLGELTQNTIGEVGETFLALVSALANRPGYFEGIQVQGQTLTRVVPPSPEERAANLSDLAAGVISKQTARQRQGIDAPEQEDAQIEKEQAQAPPPAPVTPPGGGGDPAPSPPADQ